jgi:hypothetical protein
MLQLEKRFWKSHGRMEKSGVGFAPRMQRLGIPRVLHPNIFTSQEQTPRRRAVLGHVPAYVGQLACRMGARQGEWTWAVMNVVGIELRGSAKQQGLEESAMPLGKSIHRFRAFVQTLAG